jgi:hypothetical protein
MNCDVGPTIEDRLLHLLHEHSLSTDLVQWHICSLITGGVDEHELDIELGPMSTNRVSDELRLSLCLQT